MKLLNKIFLLSALTIGVSHAGTVPCNGFKIDFKNSSNQNIILDQVRFEGANVTTDADSTNMAINKNIIYTVNQSVEGGVMAGEFLFHTATDPQKQLKLNFNLTNKKFICKLNNFSKQGTLNTNLRRVLGGAIFPIKD